MGKTVDMSHGNKWKDIHECHGGIVLCEDDGSVVQQKYKKEERCGISQETSDAAVRENIDEFDMEVQEAVDDAKTQFELMGVECVNIFADVARY